MALPTSLEPRREHEETEPRREAKGLRHTRFVPPISYPTPKMKAYLTAIGCRLNEAEIDQWRSTLEKRGIESCNDPSHAKIIIFNSCTVTLDAARKSRQRTRKLRRLAPDALLAVVGCHAEYASQELVDAGADLTLGNLEKEKVIEAIEAQHSFPIASPVMASRQKIRAFIKVQDGCNNRCAYCVVSLMRGPERSQELPAVLQQLERVEAEGAKEVILSGVHLGAYGREHKQSLAGLTQEILKASAIPRLRYGSIEPWEITPELLTVFEDKRVCPHLHIPLQSGSTSVLRRMYRRGDPKAFAQLVKTSVPQFLESTSPLT